MATATLPTNPFETSNPYAVIAPGTPSMATASAPDQATTRDASASLADYRGYDAATSEAERAQATYRTVQDNELVQRQLANIIDENSPLLERARSKALDEMNSRGLVNSSMAIGAGQAALYDYALPIARDDAAMYGTVSQDNQRYANSMSQFNASEANQTARANAGLINDARRFTSDAYNTTSRTNADNQTRVSMTNADSFNRASLQTNAQQFDASRFNADATNRATLQTNDQEFRAAMQNSDAQTRAALQAYDAEVRVNLQSSAAGSEIYRQFQANATTIMLDDRLDEPTRTAMLEQQRNMTRAALKTATALDDAEIDAILNGVGDIGGTTNSTSGTSSSGTTNSTSGTSSSGTSGGTSGGTNNNSYAGGYAYDPYYNGGATIGGVG